ncbi:MAG: RHS repeat-associated core domain-containing protein [Planctomycetaceae bacterium]
MRTSSGGGVKHYYHRNQQYSVTAVTDGSGTVVERYAYSAYGTPTITDASGTGRTTTAIGNRYTYTGREWDETLALYHYRARVYDSVAGRFVSRDPIGYRGSPWNVYEYVRSSPPTRVDPSGTDWLDCMADCLRSKEPPLDRARKTTTLVLGWRSIKVWSLTNVGTTNPWLGTFGSIGTQCANKVGVAPKVGRWVVRRTVVVITVAEGALSWWDIANCQWDCS